MKNSFLSDTWRDVAGMYKHRGEEGEFALVVREPVSVPYADLVGLPLAGLVKGAGVAMLSIAALSGPALVWYLIQNPPFK
jgi:hypothetical protein